MNDTTKRNNLKQAIAEELENTLDYDAWFFDGRENIERYDYERSMFYSVLLAMSDFGDRELDELLNEDEDTMWEYLDGQLWTSDTVTGNGSGSFFCNGWKAEAAICHNWDLIEDAQNEFGPLEFSRGAEYIDVCIRCFLASGVYQKVIENIIDRMDAIEEEQNELNAQIELNDVLAESTQENTITA